MRVLLACVLAVLCSLPRAETIGHAEFSAAQPWVPLTSYVTQLSFNGGALVIPVQNKVFYVPGPNTVPKALLIVAGTQSRIGGGVRWVSDVCPNARPKYFTEDYGSNRQTRVHQCLIVNSSFAPPSFFRADAEVLKAAKEKGLDIFKAGYSFRSVYGANGGALVRVHLMTTKAFKGLQDAPDSEPLYDVRPELVAWGEALHGAVRRSASSLGGNLELPPIEFSD
jgi:hypothetical protein